MPTRGYVGPGALWEEDNTGEVHRLAAQTVRGMLTEAAEIADPDERAALVKHALRSESASRLAAAVELARWRPGIPVTVESLDADPWALNVLNGTLDLRTGKLRPHDPRDLLTKLAPVAYDPATVCPRWERFLGEVFQGEPDLPRFLQLLAGYSLTGDTRDRPSSSSWAKVLTASPCWWRRCARCSVTTRRTHPSPPSSTNGTRPPMTSPPSWGRAW